MSTSQSVTDQAKETPRLVLNTALLRIVREYRSILYLPPPTSYESTKSAADWHPAKMHAGHAALAFPDEVCHIPLSSCPAQPSLSRVMRAPEPETRVKPPQSATPTLRHLYLVDRHRNPTTAISSPCRRWIMPVL